jgi:hypothetical protein
MARGRYVQSTDIRILRALLHFAEDERVSPLTIARIGRAYILPAAREALESLTLPEVQGLKRDLQEFFYAMAQGGNGRDSYEQRFSVSLVAAPGPKGVVLFVDGRPRDTLLYQATTCLQKVGTDRLHRCKAPDCRRAFIKVGRREFCIGRDCQRRTFLIDYDPARAQPRRKDRYGRKVSKTRKR